MKMNSPGGASALVVAAVLFAAPVCPAAAEAAAVAHAPDGSAAAKISGAALHLNRPGASTGAEADKTVLMFTRISNTNLQDGQVQVTNSFFFLELSGREKVLRWDAASDWSKVEMTVERFADGDDFRTNQLLRPQARILGTAIAGETFFRVPDEQASKEVREKLGQAYAIRPRDRNPFARTRLPETMVVGREYPLGQRAGPAESRTVYDAAFEASVSGTVELVGTTNRYGFDCFHLRFRRESEEIPQSLKSTLARLKPVEFKIRTSFTADVIGPFDASQPFFEATYCLEMRDQSELNKEGKRISKSGVLTLTVALTSRPVGQ